MLITKTKVRQSLGFDAQRGAVSVIRAEREHPLGQGSCTAGFAPFTVVPASISERLLAIEAVVCISKSRPAATLHSITGRLPESAHRHGIKLIGLGP